MSSAAMEGKGGLRVDERLARLIKDDIAPGTGVDPEHFWAAFGKLVLDNSAE
jgi:malate synthase